ncbi:MAG: DUF1156 domain-containing protein [Opitutaceae bacterium]|nr:DUF1156 domain-containing protein [Opitutaceae bacterium]
MAHQITPESPSLIEKWLPVSRLSVESQKERKAGSGQTLTGLGKWWGRKPLVLARATILASLLPATDDEAMDRRIFLGLMRMDDEGLSVARAGKALSASVVEPLMTEGEKSAWLSTDVKGKTVWSPERTESERAAFATALHSRIPYSDRVGAALRAEEVDDKPWPTSLWDDVESHLGIRTDSLAGLVDALGQKRFGRKPRVGDCFTGGGSIPFEAARIGCDAFASDLNPVAGLLTWGALNVVGASEAERAQMDAAQQEWLAKVDAQITAWGIEHNDRGERADAFLYCAETVCPNSECGAKVPMSPSWLVSQKQDLGVRLVPVEADGRVVSYGFEIARGKEISAPTVEKGSLCCPACGVRTPVKQIRGDRTVGEGEDKKTVNNLRPWEKTDFMPRPDDILTERLYCIRWVLDQEVATEKKNGKKESKVVSSKRYAVPEVDDLAREKRVVELLSERLDEWQKEGFIPSAEIVPGYNTKQPIWERGWTRWHHLFNPRQLLVLGFANNQINMDVSNIFVLGKSFDFLFSKLVRWIPANAQTGQCFSNQALNTLFNYANRSWLGIKNLSLDFEKTISLKSSHLEICDARLTATKTDIWITDPPYADAVNYHELTEFFLAWYVPHLKTHFPDWPVDSRRELAVKGAGEDFKQTMAAIYANLNRNMPDNGLQVVMFTHQDPEVWADLALILWAAGLRVSAAWVISTETESGLKEGNYVKGTVMLVLRKRLGGGDGWISQADASVRREVARQIERMKTAASDFNDGDYALASYAAALRVITGYASIDDIRPEEALTGHSDTREAVANLIRRAQRQASAFLVPDDLHPEEGERAALWGRLDKGERFLVQALSSQKRGNRSISLLQELDKGMGGIGYDEFVQDKIADAVNLKTPTQWARRGLDDGPLGKTLLRDLMLAVREVSSTGEPSMGLDRLSERLEARGRFLADAKPDALSLLAWLSTLGVLPGWSVDASAAASLRDALALRTL